MARLPQPGSDNGVWGEVLNQYLTVSHAADGAHNHGVVSESKLAVPLQIKLNRKANSSTLAPVATSGSYADLTNKPTVPTITAAATAPVNPAVGDMWVDLSS